MAGAFRANAQANNGLTGGTTAVTFTIPATAQGGDYAIAEISHAIGSATMASAPTGWTLLPGAAVSISGLATWLYGRTLPGTAGSPSSLAGTTVTWTAGSSGRCLGEMSVYSGVDPSGLTLAATTETSAATATALPTQTAPAGAIVHVTWARRFPAPPAGDVTPPTAYQQGVNPRSATAFASGIQLATEHAYRTAGTAGTYGGETATVSSASTGVNYIVVLPATGAGSVTTVSAAFAATGTLTTSVVTVTTVAAALSATGSLTAEVIAPTSTGPVGVQHAFHQWSMFSRNPDYTIGMALPILSAQAVIRHLGVGTAVATTPFNPEAWDALQPSYGIELWRDGQQQFTGRLTAREASWDRESGKAVLKLEAKGDEVLLADRLVRPDPARAADDQTVSDYWTFTGRASAAMRRLISDQAGPTAFAAYQIPGLVLGDDPNVGPSRTWSTLFLSVLDELTAISVASGANLGVRMSTDSGTLRAQITSSSDLAASVRFSADLSNLVGWTYRDEAPTITHALAAGSGDLHLRLRKLAVTTDPLATQWGRQIWSYVDRRDSDDPAELLQAAGDALAEGAPTVSLQVQLTDSQAATYGVDWGLGDRITVYVGLSGQTRLAAVSDVVREISFDVSADGTEKITPAIGSYDAKAVIPTPTQRQLANVGTALAGLIARK